MGSLKKARFLFGEQGWILRGLFIDWLELVTKCLEIRKGCGFESTRKSVLCILMSFFFDKFSFKKYHKNPAVWANIKPINTSTVKI
jgi:hypothetical protein